MAKFRQVHDSFWEDEFFMNLTPEDRYFYLYLLTNPQATACGIFKLKPTKIVESHTGYNKETIEKLLRRFCEYGKIRYNPETREVYLLNFLKYNPPKGTKTIAYINKTLKEIETQEFVENYIEHARNLGYALSSLSDAPSMPHRSPIGDTGYLILDKDTKFKDISESPESDIAEISENNNSHLDKKSEETNQSPTLKSKPLVYPKEWYNSRLAVFEECQRGANGEHGLTGSDYARARAALKRMRQSSISNEDIDGTMRALRDLKVAGQNWTQSWTMETVEKSVSKFRRGELVVPQNGHSHKNSEAVRKGDESFLKELQSMTKR